MPSLAEPRQNHLLGALPMEDGERFFVQMKMVRLTVGDVLYESRGSLTHVFFPTSAIVSLLHLMLNGKSEEVAAVGNEGMVGVPAFMGGATASSRAIVQTAGFAYSLPSHVVQKEFRRGEAFQELMLRYTLACLSEMAQTAVCNRYHTVDQQFCRWMLLRIDRLGTNVLTCTQEQIAQLLGVRREGVTEAAGRLQSIGLIEYHRGQITLLDRAGIERQACECYAEVRGEFSRLLPQGRSNPLLAHHPVGASSVRFDLAGRDPRYPSRR